LDLKGGQECLNSKMATMATMASPIANPMVSPMVSFSRRSSVARHGLAGT
jgi:hypothetical protein